MHGSMKVKCKEMTLIQTHDYADGVGKEEGDKLVQKQNLSTCR